MSGCELNPIDRVLAEPSVSVNIVHDGIFQTYPTTGHVNSTDIPHLQTLLLQKMEEASLLIKRDIVFAASLYTA